MCQTLNNTNGRTYRTKANMYSLPSTCSPLTYYVLKYNNDKIIFLRIILQVVFNIKTYLIYLDIINVFLVKNNFKIYGIHLISLY